MLPTPSLDAHCALLGVSRDASDAAVKAAFRKKALSSHPDKPGGDAEAFRQLTAAFEALMRNRGQSTTTIFDVWADQEVEDPRDTLRRACLNGSGPEVQQLLEENARQAMRKACLNGSSAEVQRLLDANADVNAVDTIGFTALKYACVSDQVLCAELLLSRGAEVDHASAGGVTALMEACTMGKEASARALLEAGASVDFTNSKGQAALMFASSGGHVPCVQLLCSYGACRSRKDFEGKTAADFARRRKHTSLAAWLDSFMLRAALSGTPPNSRGSSLRGGSAFSGLISSFASKLDELSHGHTSGSPANSRSSSLRGGSAFGSPPTSRTGSRSSSLRGGSAFSPVAFARQSTSHVEQPPAEAGSSGHSLSGLWDWARGRASPAASTSSRASSRAPSRGSSLHGGQLFARETPRPAGTTGVQ